MPAGSTVQQTYSKGNDISSNALNPNILKNNSPKANYYFHSGPNTNMTPTPVWFITAATSGFGKGIALAALAHGHKVLATGRSVSRLTDLKEAGADVYELDVTSDLETLKKTVAEAHNKYGRIDYLINSAGYILVGAVEELRFAALPPLPKPLPQINFKSSIS